MADQSETAGKWLFGLGLAAAAVGGVVWWRARNSTPKNLLGERKPKQVGEYRSGGMVSKTWRDGKMDIKQRVGLIQDLIWQGVQDPEMRKVALQITRKCDARDDVCEAREIYKAVKSRIRYSGDIAPVKMGRNGPLEAVDLYQTAKRTWEIGAGDCDDMSIVNATFLTLNGIPSRLRITARTPQDEWGHIYAMAELPKNSPSKAVALDTTLPDHDFGDEAGYGKKADFPA